MPRALVVSAPPSVLVAFSNQLSCSNSNNDNQKGTQRKQVTSTNTINFLRATAVPAGTAEARISYGDSVCPSVCHGPVQKQPSDIETAGLHHMIA